MILIKRTATITPLPLLLFIPADRLPDSLIEKIKSQVLPILQTMRHSLSEESQRQLAHLDSEPLFRTSTMINQLPGLVGNLDKIDPQAKDFFYISYCPRPRSKLSEIEFITGMLLLGGVATEVNIDGTPKVVITKL